MDLIHLRRRLQRLLVEKATGGQFTEALAAVEREMIFAVLSRRPSDGGEAGRSSLVRCPKKPTSPLNRSSVAVPLESDEP